MGTPAERLEKAAKAAIAACEKLLDATPTKAERAGRGHTSMRVFLDERTVIATRRESPERAGLEAEVLRALHEKGAAVPRILTFDGTWLIQEDLGPNTLSRALAAADEGECENLLDSALESLHRIHMAGSEAGLPERVYKIGSKPDWLPGLIGTPARLGASLDIPAPGLSETALLRLLTLPPSAFVKWDARPDNAAVRPDGAIAWFDWEHCGCRHRLDDMAWLLGDETVPEHPALEARLLDKHLKPFDEGGYPETPDTYLRCFGTFHLCVRLSILFRHRTGKATDAKEERRPSFKRPRALCRRGARWAAANPATAPLVPWFTAILNRLEDV